MAIYWWRGGGWVWFLVGVGGWGGGGGGGGGGGVGGRGEAWEAGARPAEEEPAHTAAPRRHPGHRRVRPAPRRRRRPVTDQDEQQPTPLHVFLSDAAERA
ncbi:hypothetical protein PUR61_03135, partial [Streptomyces sp. BE20]|nr:hypothetical protein [Streptomyces sp. BE20]